MGKRLKTAKITLSAIFCIAACALLAPSCFSSEWNSEPTLIINQNPYTEQALAVFSPIAQAYSSSSGQQQGLMSLLAYGSGTQASEFVPGYQLAAAATTIRPRPLRILLNDYTLSL